MLGHIFKRRTSNDTNKNCKGNKKILIVDFEYLYYSYKMNFNILPETVKIIEKIVAEHSVNETYIFADLTRQELSASLSDVNPSTATVIDTGASFFQRKKSVTDFMVLDCIYRNAAKPDVSTVILVTGDGHFRFAMDYVREMGKEIVLYAVTGSVSKSLRLPDCVVHELPSEDERYRAYYRMIVLQMAFLNDKTHIIPTFLKTAESVANYNNVPRDRIMDAISKMIDYGYMYQEEQTTRFDKPIRALRVNWSLVRKDGLWSEDREHEIHRNERKSGNYYE